MANIPRWHIDGDWFDVCNCNIPYPCEFGQAPTFGDGEACSPGTYAKAPTASSKHIAFAWSGPD